MWCDVLCCVVLWCVVLCCVVLCCVVLWCVVLCCVVLWCDVVWCAVCCVTFTSHHITTLHTALCTVHCSSQRRPLTATDKRAKAYPIEESIGHGNYQHTINPRFVLKPIGDRVWAHTLPFPLSPNCLLLLLCLFPCTAHFRWPLSSHSLPANSCSSKLYLESIVSLQLLSFSLQTLRTFCFDSGLSWPTSPVLMGCVMCVVWWWVGSFHALVIGIFLWIAREKCDRMWVMICVFFWVCFFGLRSL